MRRFRVHHQTCSLIVLGLLTFILIITRTPAIAAQGILLQPMSVIAQFTLPQLSSTDPSQPPPEVTQIGGTEIIPVKFQGESLFNIASPTVVDRKNPGNQIPVEVRAKRIHENLAYMIGIQFSFPFDDFFTTVYDPETLSMQVAILSNQTVLTATDASHTEPKFVMTVTDQDAQYNGLSKAKLAKEWRDRLQTALVDELKERSPLQLLVWFILSLGRIMFLALISSISWLMLRWLDRYKQRLKAREGKTILTPGDTSANRRFEFLKVLKRRDRIALKLSLIGFLRWLLIWILILIWLFGIALSIDKFPFIPLGMVAVLIHPLEILLIWLVAGVVNRLGDFLIYRASAFWETQQLVSGDLQRRSLRVTTIAHVLKGLKTFLVYLIAVIWILNSVDISTGSILAFGAIVGFAISLASQNLIRDLVNGFLILLEDQYAIGDVIAVDTATGVVENLNLRTTQLRNDEGRLIVLPNSTINRVENLTRTWSRVDYIVDIDISTNANQAIALIHDVAQSLYDDPEFRPLIIEQPEILGIERMSHAGIAIRTQIKTQPLQQWKVGREFRLRLKNALDEHNIQLGMP